MTPFKSLYDSLVEQGLQEPDVAPPAPLRDCVSLTGKAFSEAVLNSDEFRMYVVDGITERNIPPAVLLRLMDHGWGVPPKKLEHTGADGQPIVTEVRRVIIRAEPLDVIDTPSEVTVTH